MLKDWTNLIYGQDVFALTYLKNIKWFTIPFVDLFDLDNSGRTRGHSLKLLKKRRRLELRLYFFSEGVHG